MKKLCIFDLDGTLLDSLQDLKDSVNGILKKYSYPEKTLDQVRSYVGNGLYKLLERSVPDGCDQKELDLLYKDFLNYYGEHCNDQTSKYEGIEEMLIQLRNKGCLLAISSNKRNEQVQKLWKEHLFDLIDLAIGEDPQRGIRKKPEADEVQFILKQLNICPEEAVYIGDSEVDIQTAKNSGLDSISVSWGFKTREFLEKNGASAIADTPEELVRLLF